MAASVSIGLVSFFAPFAIVPLLCYFALDWSRRQAEIGGLALSTTSLAVVYAVLVETGLNRELVGKRLMSATFVTDIAIVAGLTILFIKPTVWIVPWPGPRGGRQFRPLISVVAVHPPMSF
jgi:Kef-type K+ transport system membrane component KefB